MSGTIGVLAMAYGTAAGPQDVERYYTDIRGGRAPAPEHLAELKSRYRAIGDRFPLLEITRQQAAALERELNASGDGQAWRVYLGMKHSEPFIAEGVSQMRGDGIERAVGLVLAPHWSGMSVQTYVDRVERSVADQGGPAFTYVRQWYDDPRFVAFLASRVRAALAELPAADRDKAAVVFSAHSLPTRALADASLRCKLCEWCPDGCSYVEQLRGTARLVAEVLGLQHTAIAWQSAGRTADPWWGPTLDEVVAELAAAGHPAVVVCSAGFVSDHLEILYDLDIETAEVARRAGISFVRTEMPNAHPEFVRALAEVVRGHVA